MLQNGYSNQDILNMKRAMGLNGWTDHAPLPENWMYRRKNRHIQYCDSKAEIYTSKEVAMKKASESGVLKGESDLTRLKLFRVPAMTEHIIPDSSWLSDSSLYPEGWKYKMCKNSTDVENRTNFKFLTADGKVLYGLRLALAYMIKNNYPLENISKMRKVWDREFGKKMLHFLKIGCSEDREKGTFNFVTQMALFGEVETRRSGLY